MLYGHRTKANPRWRLPPSREALVIFMKPDAYATPSWYATKQKTGKGVPGQTPEPYRLFRRQFGLSHAAIGSRLRDS